MTVSPNQPNSQQRRKRKNSESTSKEQALLTSWPEFSSVCMKKPTSLPTLSNSLKSVWELPLTQTLNNSTRRTKISRPRFNSWKSKYRNCTRSWNKKEQITKSNNYKIIPTPSAAQGWKGGCFSPLGSRWDGSSDRVRCGLLLAGSVPQDSFW